MLTTNQSLQTIKHMQNSTSTYRTGPESEDFLNHGHKKNKKNNNKKKKKVVNIKQTVVGTW